MRQKWLRAGQPAPTAWKKSAEGTVAAGETSPAGAGWTHPDEGLFGARMVWINGHGCQRAYSYWYYAAVAEMLVALRSPRPGFFSQSSSFCSAASGN